MKSLAFWTLLLQVMKKKNFFQGVCCHIQLLSFKTVPRMSNTYLQLQYTNNKRQKQYQNEKNCSPHLPIDGEIVFIIFFEAWDIAHLAMTIAATAAVSHSTSFKLRVSPIFYTHEL